MDAFKKEIKRFLAVGCCAVGTDCGIYFLLIRWLSHSPAKAASFFCGTIVAYLLNKYWTFEQRKKSYAEIVRFVFLYISTLGVNVLVNKISLIAFPKALVFSFLAATASSTVLNFIGQKWWVFKKCLT